METGATLHIILMIFLTPVSFGAMGLVVWWFFTQQSDNAQAQNVEEIWNHRDKWGEDICRQLIDGTIGLDMSPEMVRLAWGPPSTTRVENDDREQWTYYQRKQKRLIGSVIFDEKRVVEFSASRLNSSPGKTVWIYIALLFGLSLIVSLITLVTIFWIGG
jgi:hypothetical protein